MAGWDGHGLALLVGDVCAARGWGPSQLAGAVEARSGQRTTPQQAGAWLRGTERPSQARMLALLGTLDVRGARRAAWWRAAGYAAVVDDLAGAVPVELAPDDLGGA